MPYFYFQKQVLTLSAADHFPYTKKYFSKIIKLPEHEFTQYSVQSEVLNYIDHRCSNSRALQITLEKG